MRDHKNPISCQSLDSTKSVRLMNAMRVVALVENTGNLEIIGEILDLMIGVFNQDLVGMAGDSSMMKGK